MNLILMLKQLVSSILTHPMVGGIIGWAMGNRITAFGLRIDTSNPAISPRTKAKLFFGIYESSERRFVSKYLPLEAHVVELGSSIGVLTCLIRKAVPSHFKVVAVEANPNLIPLLRHTLESNGCAKGTFVEAAAISYRPDGFSLVSDIEGAEWAMFEQDLTAVEAAKIIIIELHKSEEGKDWRELLDRILATGRFDLVDQYGPTCVIRPVERHSTQVKV